MPIYKSSEFKGFGFDYDQSQQPFFKAIVKETPHAGLEHPGAGGDVRQDHRPEEVR